MAQAYSHRESDDHALCEHEHPRGARPALPTLGDVTEHLSSVLIDVVAAPRGLAVPVAEVVIHDPVEPAALQPHDVLLAIGVRPSDRAALLVLNTAAEREASAVVYKADALPPALIAHAEDRGLALLAVPHETNWGQLHALLRTAISSAGAVLQRGRHEAPAGDLFTLADAVAAMVGGPATIEDPQSRVLAYSNLDQEVDEGRRATILGRRVPEEYVERLRREGVFTRLWSGDEVVTVAIDGLQTRMAVAVRAGREILGSIWVADGGKPFEPSAPAALREAAAIAALHLVRHRVGEDLERRMRGELLLSLLEGRGSVDAVAERLGLDPETPTTVVAFELQGGDDAEDAVRLERVRDLIATYCQAFRRRVAQVAVDRIVYALLPSPASATSEGLTRLARDIVQRVAGALSVDVRVGIGSTVSHLRDVPRSRTEADRVLRVLARSKHPTMYASIRDVHPHAVMLELEELLAQRPHMRSEKLAVLQDHDAAHGSAYIDTLRAYLWHFGDVVAAAASLDVHANTFRYRLRRLSEVSRIELGDVDERLVTELQLRLL